MPRPTLQQVSGVGDVATTYQWNVNFVSFPTLLYGGALPSTEDLNLRMTSTTRPTKGSGDLEIPIRGHKVFQAGQADYGDNTITMTFVETVDAMIQNFFLAWTETCVQTGTGVHGSNAEAKCVIQIEQLDRQDNPFWLYTLRGCRLRSYTLTDNTSEEALQLPSLTIKFDDFTQKAV